MGIGNKILTAFVFAAMIVLFVCKKEEAPVPQIVGTKYSGFDQSIYKKPGTTSKTEFVTTVYGMEEVTGLEIVNHEGLDAKGNKTVTEYLKLKTVDNKEGYAPSKNFFEAVLFAVGDGDQAFVKNSLTSPTKGKLERGMYCFEIESNGDFAKVNCYGSILKNGKLNNLLGIWIQPNSPTLSKDPLLGDSLRNLKAASATLIELAKAGDDTAKQDKLKAEASKTLKTVADKGDQFLEDANALATEFGLSLTE
ncbi:lipoprotein LenA [Leptospira semungkisensis]|uniref:Lipoprotein LenA n=1 Tax=Leptospira semungkisensis TaxID=2484985 RepID=A0A4R9G6C7_9LEPT|nr:lipoprotein LenA [Leptospira semungkisensis]TGK07158.1 lipoprotein LenA [Leptospira semungkisensis]